MNQADAQPRQAGLEAPTVDYGRRLRENTEDRASPRNYIAAQDRSF